MSSIRSLHWALGTTSEFKIGLFILPIYIYVYILGPKPDIQAFCHQGIDLICLKSPYHPPTTPVAIDLVVWPTPSDDDCDDVTAKELKAALVGGGLGEARG